jgi:uncharacterized protein YabN with tetrapyrrole methylase and pyrophosphatase domain
MSSDTFEPLRRAETIQREAAARGFDWPDPSGPLQKLHEELAELVHAVESQDDEEMRDEMGDLLFSIVNLARHLDIDAGEALDRATKKFSDRWSRVQVKLQFDSRSPETMSLEELDKIWDAVKRNDLRRDRNQG